MLTLLEVTHNLEYLSNFQPVNIDSLNGNSSLIETSILLHYFSVALTNHHNLSA